LRKAAVNSRIAAKPDYIRSLSPRYHREVHSIVVSSSAWRARHDGRATPTIE